MPHPHLTLPGGAHGIDRAADPTPRLLDVAEDNARLLGQAGVRRGPEGGRAGPGRPGLSLTMRERWQGRPGSPYARAAGGWLARTGSLPAGLPVEVNTGHGDRPQPAAARAAVAAGVDALEHRFRLEADLARVMAAQGRRWWRPWPCWSPGTASGRPPGCPGLPRPKGGRRWPSGGRRPMRRSGSPIGAGVLVGAGTDFGGGWLRPNQLPRGGRDAGRRRAGAL